MVANTVLTGYAIELEVEFEPNQEPQRKKERSLDSTESQDYDLENDIGEFADSGPPTDSDLNPFNIQKAHS